MTCRNEAYESVTGEISQWERVNVFSTRGGEVDMLFCIDHSASMANKIDDVRNNIVQFVNDLEEQDISIRLGLVSFQDGPILYNSASLPDTELTDDPVEFKNWVASLTMIPGRREQSLDAVTAALAYKLRPESQKMVVLITDEPPTIFYDQYDGIAVQLTEAQESIERENAVLFYWGQGAPLDRLGGTYLGSGSFTDALMNGLKRYIIDHFAISGDSPFPADGTMRRIVVHTSVDGDVGSDSCTYRAPQYSYPPPIPEDPACAPGDVNGDGVTDMTDVQLVLDLAVGLVPQGEYSFCRADRNSDGIITPDDAEKLMRTLR